ncbi:hypothetical protein BDF14DRAFT_258124 [Spinellus fusiger]|nr:hypothetical protein BDF14DRAFT_258124 [Spinellus fusiger]
MAPVYYENGKFYCDDIAGEEARQDRPSMRVPDYERVFMDPLGYDSLQWTKFSSAPFPSSRVCWNCDSEDHQLSDCPEKRNQAKIRENSKRHRESHPSKGLFDTEEAGESSVASFEPGKLSESLKKALGMAHRDSEPQYYRNMRMYGYPPGYMGSEPIKGVSQLPITKESVIFEEIPLLKVYDDEEPSEEEESPKKRIKTDTKDTPVSTDKKHVRLVDYQGLDLYEHGSNEQPPYQHGYKHEQQYSYYQPEYLPPPQIQYYQQPYPPYPPYPQAYPPPQMQYPPSTWEYPHMSEHEYAAMNEAYRYTPGSTEYYQGYSYPTLPSDTAPYAMHSQTESFKEPTPITPAVSSTPHGVSDDEDMDISDDEDKEGEI